MIKINDNLINEKKIAFIKTKKMKLFIFFSGSALAEPLVIKAKSEEELQSWIEILSKEIGK